MYPAFNWFVITGTGALDELTTVFRVGKVTDVVTENTTVFIDLDDITSAVTAHSLLLKYFSIAVDVVLFGAKLWTFLSLLASSGRNRSGRRSH